MRACIVQAYVDLCMHTSTSTYQEIPRFVEVKPPKGSDKRGELTAFFRQENLPEPTVCIEFAEQCDRVGLPKDTFV